jgi:5-methyltetrahydropteroyltriglutamate--homocysteine methyltransferase
MTIGSFPQTGDMRSARAAWRAGRMTERRTSVSESGDTPLHPEAVKPSVSMYSCMGNSSVTTMGEYFGEQLDGVALTEIQYCTFSW